MIKISAVIISIIAYFAAVIFVSKEYQVNTNKLYNTSIANIVEKQYKKKKENENVKRDGYTIYKF